MSGMPDPRIRRILMTGDTVGGVWTFTMELARALAGHEIEVVLATLGGSASPAQIAEASGIGNVCLLDSDFKLEWMEEPWSDIESSRRWLMELEREYCPDVIHLNSFGHGALPWRAPTVLTAHSCVLSWWSAVKGEAAPASWSRYQSEVARSLEAAGLVTAPSAAMAEALTRHYGFGAPECTVISNGRDPAHFCAGMKSPLILTAGRIWDQAKNVAAMDAIAPSLPWPVYVAGDPAKSILNGCRALGRLDPETLAGWYGRAAIYALPARYEPFGLSALEAALSGCALVLGDIASLREIWDGAAVFVSPDDTRALLRALEGLIGDEARRDDMAQRAYMRALKFGATRMAQRYLESYSAVVAARNRQCVS